MNSTFKDMVHQIFQCEDFIEDVYINGFKQKCVQSTVTDNLIYTEAGLSNGVNFSLDLQLATLHRIPEEGDKVEYRGKFYKIASTETDSANASMKLFLISTSKGA